MKKYIYLCGPTVYDKVHIGNMRPIVTFDLILRGYKHLYPDQYVFIHNITDIDDKIINQAQKLKMSESEISTQYFLFYKEMLKEYNVQTIDKMPKVTEHIGEIASFIQNILNNKNGYEVNNLFWYKQIPSIWFSIKYQFREIAKSKNSWTKKWFWFCFMKKQKRRNDLRNFYW